MFRFLLLLAIVAFASAHAGEHIGTVHHALSVTLQPKTKSLEAVDQITLPVAMQTITVELHGGLKPEFSSTVGEVEVLSKRGNNYLRRYILQLPAESRQFTVTYTGKIHHQLGSSRAEQARGFRSSAGIIDNRGVFLAASSFWYPRITQFPYLTYSLDVELPRGWLSVSQGQRLEQKTKLLKTQESWAIDKPQEEIYLIAAKFTEYVRPMQAQQGRLSAKVFLREEDEKLAGKYLDATVKYLKMYEQLLGPYAYSKFALVENFWETGFGMPSFTLLGSRVIRLPFILNSSYPHEILHNWWGNGVYIDFSGGNWSEGLTAYLADHLIKEQQGQGANYRQQSLQKYRDYAANNRDFALTEFTGRHSSATEAVGYGKTLMLFHMLRKKLGDERFTQSLQQLYRQYLFRVASFDDVRQVFEQVSGQALRDFFDQWVQRVGAPELKLVQTRVEETDDKYLLHLVLEQAQAGEAYTLDIPVAVTLANQASAREVVVVMNSKRQSFSLELPAMPVRVDVDPRFDLFRKLAAAETPPAFTQVFGATDLLVVTPSQAEQNLKAAWQEFARDVSHMGPERVKVVDDSDIAQLPADQAVVVLGWSNRFAAELQQDLGKHPVEFGADRIRVKAGENNRKNHAFAWVTRVDLSDDKSPPRAFVAADLPAALPGLGRKIPHYHKYSYLGFEGDEPQNRLKGRWPVTDSPMSAVLQRGAERGRLAKSRALVDPVSTFDSQRMMHTVRFLSDPGLQGRGLGSKGLNLAADYIAAAFERAGLQPAGDDGGYFQRFAARGEDGKNKPLKNVVGVIPGRHPKLSRQNLVIGAHYDHLGLGWPDVRLDNQGHVHNGADDNASGIAVVIELARSMARSQPDRSIVFVAFSGEEAGRRGSKFYVENARDYPVAESIGMLNLDTVGRLNDKKLMVLGAESATEWPHIFRGIGFVTGIESVMVSEPLDASDQISFHEAGIPAVQLFSGPHTDYHRPGDTADKIDAEGLVKVAEVSKQVIEYLASREQPMTITLSEAKQILPEGGSRKVSLGTIPDFTYQGTGYRLDGVTPGSPAAQVGLTKADIIVQIEDTKITGIRDISQALKSFSPGQEISITYLRAGKRSKVTAVLNRR